MGDVNELIGNHIEQKEIKNKLVWINLNWLWVKWLPYELNIVELHKINGCWCKLEEIKSHK